MLVEVVIDLAAICKKVAKNPAVPETLRSQASEYVQECEALLPARGKGTPAEHFQGETLLIKMARFLPQLLEVRAMPRPAGG
jgi:hypothetical protein